MTHISQDIYVEQGATYSKDLQVKDYSGAPVDITSYTDLIATVKHYNNSTESFTATVVKTNATTGVFTLSISPAETAKMVFSRGTYNVTALNSIGSRVILFGGQVIVSEMP